MKKVIFLSAAASLSMAMHTTIPEEFRHLITDGAFALRRDDASDNSLYGVQNDSGRKLADDEQDNELAMWVDADRFALQALRLDDESSDNSLNLINGGVHILKTMDDETQDNELIINKIKDTYYGATNWYLQNPEKVYQITNFGANMLSNPKWDDELMQRATIPEKLKKVHNKKNKVVQTQVQDNNLIGFDGGIARDDEVQDNNLIINTIKNGYYDATNWYLRNPEKVYQITNFGVNMLSNPKWDDEELMIRKKSVKHVQPTQSEQAEQPAQPIHKSHNKKKNQKFRPIAQPQPEVQAQPETQADNTLFDLGALLGDAEN